MNNIAGSNSAPLRVPVAIVGGGPVGMGLAIELGQRGIRCLIVERYANPQSVPKGQNLTQRTLEHFHFWGAERALRAARTIPRDYGIGGVTAYRTLLGEHAYDWFQRGLRQSVLLYGKRKAASVRDRGGPARSCRGIARAGNPVRLGGKRSA